MLFPDPNLGQIEVNAAQPEGYVQLLQRFERLSSGYPAR
jgi:hypothetical protein